MAKRSRKKLRPTQVTPSGHVKIEANPTRQLLQAALIVATVFWVFWPSVHGQWIGDDRNYLTENPLMNDPDRLWKAWFQPGSWVEYYPIQESVQWLQWQHWHGDTFGYHLTNIILHAISALLVWRLLARLGLRLAWLGGLIFAIHPMVVDSVTLINELKTTLSFPPFLLAMCAWIDYEEHRRRRDYRLALGFFIIAMLCKITMAMFPFVLLLYSWWRRNRVTLKDITAVMPFFAVSAVLGMATVLSGFCYNLSKANPADIDLLGGLLPRLANTGLTLSFYFSKCFLPVNLMPIYPQWSIHPTTLLQFLPWLVGGAAIWFLWKRRAGWGRHVLFGLGFFLIFLAPFSGFHWVTYMIQTWVLDHLVYIPIIGLIGLVVAGLEQVEKQLPATARPFAIGLMALTLIVLACGSRAYAMMFINEETIGAYAVKQNPGSWLARDHLGCALCASGREAEGIPQLEEALELNPHDIQAHYNLGNALMATGQMSEAISQYQKTVRLAPTFASAHYNFGNALMQVNRVSEAIGQYQQAVQIQPDDAAFHDNLGVALSQIGQMPEAIEQFKTALQIDPTYVNARNNLGWSEGAQKTIPAGP